MEVRTSAVGKLFGFSPRALLLPLPELLIVKTRRGRHGRCHVCTLRTTKEVAMAAQGSQTLTNLLCKGWKH